ncbi:MAG: hypothetical protein E7331_10835 [Clostridiales bacterium]|nr:hypothetical protein [Clostridiales bacterium]
MNYDCLYCGKSIAPEEILFFNETTQLFEDSVRFDFLEKHGMYVDVQTVENKYGRLYYHVSDENISRRDINGFPTLISARPCDGLTPDELFVQKDSIDANSQMETVVTQEEKPEEPAVEEFVFGGQSSFGMFGGAQESQPESSSPFQQVNSEQTQKPADTELCKISSRACPHCHCELPLDFGLIPSYFIQLLGGRACGKTAFLTCLHQQLDKQLQGNDLGSVCLEKESNAYLQPKIQYYEETGTPRPTPLNESIFPLVYHFTTSGSNTRKKAFIVIHDIAGEGMVGKMDYLLSLKGMERSTNFLYLFDSNQLTRGGYHSAVSIMENETNSNGHDFCAEDLFSQIVSVGASVQFITDDKGCDNLVAVMTKLDLPLRVEKAMFEHGKMEIMNDIGKSHYGQINRDVLDRVRNEIALFVDAKAHAPYGTNRLLRELAAAFQCSHDNIFLSGISTYTRSVEEQNQNRFNKFDFRNQYNSEGSKHRIIEPFLLLLWRFGLLPARKDGIDSYCGETEEANGKQKKKRGLFARKKK